MANYVKNFDEWNAQKKQLDQRVLSDDFFFLEGEIWWTSIGLNIGHEIDGKNESFERPILILKKINEDTLIGLPITTKGKYCNEYYNFRYHNIIQAIVLSQIRTIDARRLIRYERRINAAEMKNIQNKLIDFLKDIKEIPSK